MPRRRVSVEGEESSALRRARLARNWTLEDVVEEIDLRTRGGHSGVTPSMVSGWELGRHTTSIGHRKTLCEIYGQPPQVLFVHQDAGLRAEGAPPRLLAGFTDLREAMLATVSGARECLVAAGSRSRDAGYLAAIEAVLAERPAWCITVSCSGRPTTRCCAITCCGYWNCATRPIAASASRRCTWASWRTR